MHSEYAHACEHTVIYDDARQKMHALDSFF